MGLLSGFNPHPTSWLGASWESELAGRYLAWFQSSPNREAGCSLDYSANSCCKFQSSPNLLVRCSLIFPRIMKVGFFNSHPTSGLGAMSPSFQLLLVDVSILTQLLGWVQCCLSYPSFKSHPNLQAGCSACTVRLLPAFSCFNPHPTCWMGAAPGGTEWGGMLLLVSIFTQPIGWVQLSQHEQVAICRGFNPHPTERLDAT